MATEFKLPDLGEGIVSGTVTSIMVSEGDSISPDQAILELETDKAVIELPFESEGVVKKIMIKEGDEVKVGQPILEFDAGTTAEKKAPEPESSASAADQQPAAAAEEEAPAAEKKPVADKQEKTPPAESKPSGKAMETDVTIPELGENIESGTVSAILVKEGDTIEENQALLELETDKAVLEMPSEVSGSITGILIKEGDEVKVGQKIMTVSTTAASPKKEAKKEEPAIKTVDTPVSGDQQSPTPSKAPAPATEQKAVSFEPARSPGDIAPAAPSVRRFAREIGIDINQVPGTGPGGRISVDDVKSYSKLLNRQRSAQSSVFKGFDAEPLPDFSKWGQVDTQSMSNVRQKTATHLSYAWAIIPQVTQFEKADITEIEKLRKQYAKKAEAAGGKLTMTAILTKIVEAALHQFPQFNSSIDMQNKEIIYKKYYNIGIAVDTDRGLLVPVIKDVDQKNIIEIAVEMTRLAEKARSKKLSLEEMQGGNFSISNLGGIGGTAFTPIVNSPEVAILGVSRGKMEPVYKDGEFVPRLLLPLSLTYDHRIIDGADAMRFLSWISQALEQPFLLSLEG